MQAEIVVRAIADLAKAGRTSDVAALEGALGEEWAIPGIAPEQLATICQRLQDGGVKWAALTQGESLDVVWRGGGP